MLFSMNGLYSNIGKMNKAFQKLVFPLYYQKLFSETKYNSDISIREYLRLFCAYKDCAIYLSDIDSPNYQQKALIMGNLQSIKEINPFITCSDFKIIRGNIFQEICNLYDYIVNSLSLLKAILVYADRPQEPIKTLYQKMLKYKSEIEETKVYKFKNPKTLQDINLSSIISKDFNIFYEEIVNNNKKISDHMDLLREQHHMCIICRNKPAVYFAKPCCHPNFCTSCLNDFVKQNFTYNRCLNCKEIVKSIESNRFFQF
ncbi:hypothetical protein TRFO_06803 [Tritrichomonas foetus]|uniref:RING-type domain-containing protein n=1 Tax=Tritrichomonas foetus TaxID=1144522 RepID=A0A1J4K073_9EUKA|nr:hypothetical protein TRFO_06803 [Tritrichomonas foetus]|eukprot:OHT03142.1 hypothetical protein TRFO_06803 [Tritrichomonas foetus]